MKICAVIAEYNPFHLGHLKQLEYIKTELKAEKIVVIMSGDFTQRGEPAILNKFTRAKHAILAGADAVIELPAVFAVGSAETFATGAVKIIDDIKAIDGICFGIESGKKEDFLSLAGALNDESREFKKILKAHLEDGVSHAKARFFAVKELYGKEYSEDLIHKPNNILGVEYARAVLKNKSRLEIFPMLRNGEHNDARLKKGITSATSIRLAVRTGNLKKTKGCVPPYVFGDLKGYPEDFDKMIISALHRASAEELSEVPDCTEGLENRIKALITGKDTVEDLVEKISTKRYTAARVRRIFISNFLGIKKSFAEECLKEQLYAKVLAVKSESKDLISTLAEKSEIPVILRKSDAIKLKKTAAACYEIDTLSNELYNLAANEKQNQNLTLII